MQAFKFVSEFVYEFVGELNEFVSIMNEFALADTNSYTNSFNMEMRIRM